MACFVLKLGLRLSRSREFLTSQLDPINLHSHVVCPDVVAVRWLGLESFKVVASSLNPKKCLLFAPRHRSCTQPRLSAASIPEPQQSFI